MKIDLDWIKKELDAGREVELECVDEEKYLNLEACWRDSRQAILDSSLIITGLYGHNEDNLEVEGLNRIIPSYHFKHFRIKRHAPTFDDLIDVAVQAYKDGVLSKVELRDDEINLTKLGVISSDRGSSVFQDTISDINSLYTETFVIESEDDLRNIKKEAIIMLQNGNEVCAESDCLYHHVKFIQTTYAGNNFNLSFISLKGATVTQKR